VDKIIKGTFFFATICTFLMGFLWLQWKVLPELLLWLCLMTWLMGGLFDSLSTGLNCKRVPLAIFLQREKGTLIQALVAKTKSFIKSDLLVWLFETYFVIAILLLGYRLFAAHILVPNPLFLGSLFLLWTGTTHFRLAVNNFYQLTR